MKTTSDKFKAIAESDSARYYVKISNDNIEINDDIDDFQYSIIVNDNSYFSIGNTASAIVSFSINEPSQDLEDLELTISQGINVDGTMEYVDLGIFKVLEPTDNRGVYSYQCVDRMTYLMDNEYVSTLSLPTTDLAMIKDICSQVGISFLETGFVSHSINLIPSGYTKREIIGYMAQLQGKNAIINEDGNLEFIWYTETDYVIDDNKIYYDGTSEITSETDFEVGYVSCTVYNDTDVTELVSGSGNVGVVLENPFMTQTILDEIFEKIGGFTFATGSFDFLGDFRLEVGDIVTVETNDTSYKIPIMQLEHSSDGGVVSSITSIGQTETQDGIDNTSPTDRVLRRLSYQIRDSRRLISENAERIIEQGTEIEVVQGQIESKVWQQDIINNYSTGSKSGSPILLTDSANSNLIDFTAYGASTQDGTPTLDAPIDIKSVGDSGYFDGELVQGYYATDGSVTSYAGRISAKNLIPCNEGDEINLIYEEVVDTLIIAYFKDNVWLSQVTANSVSELSGTVPSGANQFGVTVYKDEIIPSTAKHICVIINGMYALIQKSVNKNFMNSTATSTTDNGVNYVVNENKSISTSGTAAATSAFSIIGTANGAKYEEIPDLVVGETYTLSGCDENGASGVYQLQFNIKKSDGTITYNADYGKTFTFTHEEGNTYLSYVRYGSSVTANQTFYPMIRPIDTDDTYVPHEEKTTYISLTEPLRGIGNIADSIKKVEGLYQAERKFIELIFDGSDDEEFSLHSTNDNGIANFHITSSSFDFNNSCQSICTHFTRNNNSISTITEECYAVSTNAFYFRVKSERCSTVEEWKTLLAESPVKIVIEVLTTIIEDLDQTPFYNLKTFDDVTLISASDDAEMEVSYYRNTEDGKRIGGGYSLISQRIDDIVLEVSDLSNDISAKLELKIDKDDNDQIVSMINASADEINLKSNRFSLESDYTSITKDGVFTTVSGDIGGWKITSSGLEKSEYLSTYGYTTTVRLKPSTNPSDNVFEVINGNVTNGYIKTDGGAKFYYVKTGDIQCSSLDCSGVIHTTSGIWAEGDATLSSTLYVTGNTTHKGAVYLADGTTYYLSAGGSAVLNTMSTNGGITVGGAATFKSGIELTYATAYIDFHYGNSTADYTSRIIENASGTLTFCANVVPDATVTRNLGSSSLKWSNTHTYMLYYTSQSQTSDKRLKEEISDIDNRYLELWDLLNPQQFKFIGQDKTSLGIIAQELEEAMLEVGLTEKDCGFLNKQWIESEDYTGYEYGVDYTFINILNYAKLKQLQKEIEKLKA